MTNIHPLLGQAVMYTLSKQDCDIIVSQRRSAGIAAKQGNDPRPGDVLPGVIVKVWGPIDPRDDDHFAHRPAYERENLNSAFASSEHPENRHVNLQVLLDGNDTFWATSRTEFTPTHHRRIIESPNDLGAHDDEASVPDPQGHWTRA